MSGIELLRDVYEWLPLLFALVLLFQLVADHPLAASWWWNRPRQAKAELGLA